MIAAVVAVIVIISSLVQLFYCGYFFSRISKGTDAMGKGAIAQRSLPVFPELPVSILICAKNEGSNLQANLPFILAACYHDAAGRPLFEVVVVNDQSDDNSAAVLEALQAVWPHLKVVTITADVPRTLPGKKFALSKGVEAASYDTILMTDADCKPVANGWIAHMAFPFTQGKALVAGYGGFYQQQGLLNLFIRAETLHTFLQYLTYNLAGLPYMAVGRNLAAKKSLLLQAQVQPVWRETVSGDDDLLIRLCATDTNMVVHTHPSSFTISEAKETWRAWVRQKQRHLSTGKLYQGRIKMLLGGYAMSHALCWAGVLLMPLVWDAGLWLKIALALFALRCCWFWRQLIRTKHVVSEPGLRWFLPIFDFAWLLYNFIFTPYIFWKNKQQWT